jgi:hypothetical protein
MKQIAVHGMSKKVVDRVRRDAAENGVNCHADLPTLAATMRWGMVQYYRILLRRDEER